ncbi:MAG TPA: hypothetical protein VMY59_08935 [Candidatus Thermoplasmatota archaeon]|nr:hypothetical protein [Candidatus Thermoplasmatota archaeon]
MAITKRCGRCKQIKNIEQFNELKSPKNGFNSNCKTCIIYYKDWVKKNPEKARKKQKRWYISDLEKHREDAKIYSHSEKGQQQIKQRIFVLKNTVFNHYSPGGIKCALSEANHPGYDCIDFEVLSIDHVNGNGANHRREIKVSGNRFYLWLIQHGFPEGYRVLCYNCQQKEKIRLKLLTGNRSNHPTKY